MTKSRGRLSLARIRLPVGGPDPVEYPAESVLARREFLLEGGNVLDNPDVEDIGLESWRDIACVPAHDEAITRIVRELSRRADNAGQGLVIHRRDRQQVLWGVLIEQAERPVHR